MDKDTERIEKYKTLSTPEQNLYGSPESGAFMYGVFQKYNLEESLYSFYAEIIGDTILGFNKIADMPRLFQQKLKLSADDSQRLTSQLIDFLSPIVDREEQEARVKKEGLANLTETFASKTAPTPEDTQILQAAAENVVPLRTMQGDINRIHGYGAYNEALENGEVQEEVAVVRSTQEQLINK